MGEDNWLAEQFEAHRNRLQAVGYRMLGSRSEADDAVQEAWIRLSRSDVAGVENLGGWLTTVVSRVCLDMLRSRESRKEEPVGTQLPEEVAGQTEIDTGLADSIGPALLVVLETLTPAERLAFVLHDLFAVSFEEIAPIVGRSPAAARQLASRARRRVQGPAAVPDADVERHKEIVAAFLTASREGNFDALLALLDPEVVIRADAAARKLGASKELRGAAEVARAFIGRARSAQPALIDGTAGAVGTHEGQARLVFDFAIADGKIVEIELLGDPAHIAQLDLEFRKDWRP